jgi:hypothetical protein
MGPSVSLVERLAHTQDGEEACVERGAELRAHLFIGVAEEAASFGVANQHPRAPRLPKHGPGDGGGEGSLGLRKEVLASDVDRGALESL